MRLTLFVDHRCDLACSYCYNGKKFRRAMPLATARGAVDLVLDSGDPLSQVGFFGGEPLLRFDFVREVTAYVKECTAGAERPTTMVVTTNGTRLDDRTLPFLGENGFFLGVSFDGCRPAHDACRRYADGSSSYDRVVAGVRAALAAGVPVKTISVIDPANVACLAESFDHVLDLGVRQLSVNVNYEAEWNETDRAAFRVALERLADRYVDAYRRGVAFRLNLLDSKIVTHLKGGFACADRCDFGCAELAVAPSGRLYPCDRLIGEDDRDDVVIGTVEGGVDEARRDALIADKNRELAECRDCELVTRCMHWCGCVNYAMTGRVGEVDGLLCWIERALVAVADRAADTLFAERNERFLRRFYSPSLGAGISPSRGG